MTGKVRLGVSTCLLGERVRYDGGHKRDGYLTETLDPLVEWVPVCPEFEMGLGAPRERMRLVGDPQDPRLIALPSETDLTGRMAQFNEQTLRALESAALDGFVLKSDSPTCGLMRVRVYRNRQPVRTGRGLWARALSQHMPMLPIEEDGRLRDASIRESFIARIFAHHRLRLFAAEPVTAASLQSFHADNKYLLLAHDPSGYRELGRLVAAAPRRVPAVTIDEYRAGFLRAMTKRATRAKNTNVLQHLQGFVKDALDDEDRTELTDLIQRYRAELVPLVVPVTLLRHHLRKHAVDWARRQTYLEPYPAELMLRNHV